MLVSAGILPSNTTTYTLIQLQNAVKAQTGAVEDKAHAGALTRTREAHAGAVKRVRCGACRHNDEGEGIEGGDDEVAKVGDGN